MSASTASSTTFRPAARSRSRSAAAKVAFSPLSRVSTPCLQNQRDKALSHDHLFHSVLGLMAVKTTVYQRELDFFAACEGR